MLTIGTPTVAAVTVPITVTVITLPTGMSSAVTSTMFPVALWLTRLTTPPVEFAEMLLTVMEAGIVSVRTGMKASLPPLLV